MTNISNSLQQQAKRRKMFRIPQIIIVPLCPVHIYSKQKQKHSSSPYGHLEMLPIVFKTKINSTRSAFQEFIAKDDSENMPKISF